MRNTEPESGWRQRRILSATLRVAATMVPVLASLAVGLLGDRVLPEATTIPGALLRSLGILAVSLPVLVVVDAGARRFLPLAALLQLSLVFPDQTPSRFKLALKAGSGRRLARAVGEARENGLSDEPSEAAEQLVILAAAISDHDRRTRGHSERVRLYAELIGEELGLGDDDRAKLQWAALIHDIGKVTVPPEILNKKGKPDPAEWAILQAHPAAGESLVAPVEGWLGEWVHAIGGHHEKWDGSGYPRGLAGAEIARSAAIVAVADSFEVMTAVRSYKKAMSLADARTELTRCAGSHFSPEVVRAFLNLSIGDLRRSMGIIATLAHVPIIGRLSTAASYAPDTVSTAVGMTTSAATAGAGAVAVTAAVAVGTSSMAAAAPTPAPPTPVVTQLVADATVDVGHEITVGRPSAVTAAAHDEPAAVSAESAPPAPEAEAETDTEEAEVAAAPTRRRTSSTTPITVRRTRSSTLVIDEVEPPATTPTSVIDLVAAEHEIEASNAPTTDAQASASTPAADATPPRVERSGSDHGSSSRGRSSGSGSSETPRSDAATHSPAEPAVEHGNSGSGNGNSGGNSANAGSNAHAGGHGSAGDTNGGGNGNSGGNSDASVSTAGDTSNGNGNGNSGGNGNGGENGNPGGNGNGRGGGRGK